MSTLRYKVDLTNVVVLKRLDQLPKKAREWIIRDIEKKLETNPAHYGKRLSGDKHDLFKLRVDIYRVIFKIDENSKTVKIVEIDYRRDIY
jgi:mRNA interferase RelE/StbE